MGRFDKPTWRGVAPIDRDIALRSKTLIDAGPLTSCPIELSMIAQSRKAKKSLSRLCRPQVTPTKQLHVRPDIPETVEQFLARGGQVERLDVGVCSRSAPLSHRELNNVSWKQRSAALDKRNGR